MLRSKIIPAAVAVTVALGSAVVFANEVKQDDERQEAAAVLNAKTSLAQAIAVAEQQTGGKAIESGIENQNGKVIGYDVKVAKGNIVQKVVVDLNSGQLLKVVPVDAGHGENGEHESED
jgi:uncharacterized membrane protein YkoI